MKQNLSRNKFAKDLKSIRYHQPNSNCGVQIGPQFELDAIYGLRAKSRFTSSNHGYGTLREIGAWWCDVKIQGIQSSHVQTSLVREEQNVLASYTNSHVLIYTHI